MTLGFLRPEIRFASLQDLVFRIMTDVGLAKTQLALPRLEAFSCDPFLLEVHRP